MRECILHLKFKTNHLWCWHICLYFTQTLTSLGLSHSEQNQKKRKKEKKAFTLQTARLLGEKVWHHIWQMLLLSGRFVLLYFYFYLFFCPVSFPPHPPTTHVVSPSRYWFISGYLHGGGANGTEGEEDEGNERGFQEVKRERALQETRGDARRPLSLSVLSGYDVIYFFFFFLYMLVLALGPSKAICQSFLQSANKEISCRKLTLCVFGGTTHHYTSQHAIKKSMTK